MVINDNSIVTKKNENSVRILRNLFHITTKDIVKKYNNKEKILTVQYK